MGEFTKEFTSDNFDAEVIKCDKPVLVDFLGRVVWTLQAN